MWSFHLSINLKITDKKFMKNFKMHLFYIVYEYITAIHIGFCGRPLTLHTIICRWAVVFEVLLRLH
jgi:hypothetical protein